jgi:hypothetical protein
MKSWAGKALEPVNCFAFLKCKLTVNLKFINKKSFCFFFSLFAMFYIKSRITSLLKTNMFNHVPIKKRREIKTLHCSKWFIFSTSTQPRFSFERTIDIIK